jgi:hypothetical protein
MSPITHYNIPLMRFRVSLDGARVGRIRREILLHHGTENSTETIGHLCYRLHPPAFMYPPPAVFQNQLIMTWIWRHATLETWNAMPSSINNVPQGQPNTPWITQDDQSKSFSSYLTETEFNMAAVAAILDERSWVLQWKDEYELCPLRRITWLSTVRTIGGPDLGLMNWMSWTCKTKPRRGAASSVTEFSWMSGRADHRKEASCSHPQ